MEAELASYAEEAISGQITSNTTDDEDTIGIEDRIASFDGTAARQTIAIVRRGFKEISEELNPFRFCAEDGSSSSDDNINEDSIIANGHSPTSEAATSFSENTPLLV